MPYKVLVSHGNANSWKTHHKRCWKVLENHVRWSVRTLDSRRLFSSAAVSGCCCWQTKANGQELFEKVCDRLDVNEREYFCLSYKDNVNNIRVSWLDALLTLLFNWNELLETNLTLYLWRKSRLKTERQVWIRFWIKALKLVISQLTERTAFHVKNSSKHDQWKKRPERRKHCALAVVRRSQKFLSRRRPHPGGTGRPKFNQLEMVTTLTYKPSLVKIDARNFELSR